MNRPLTIAYTPARKLVSAQRLIDEVVGELQHLDIEVEGAGLLALRHRINQVVEQFPRFVASGAHPDCSSCKHHRHVAGVGINGKVFKRHFCTNDELPSCPVVRQVGFAEDDPLFDVPPFLRKQAE